MTIPSAGEVIVDPTPSAGVVVKGWDVSDRGIGDVERTVGREGRDVGGKDGKVRGVGDKVVGDGVICWNNTAMAVAVSMLDCWLLRL
jgi:hypothetical protein